MTAQAIAQPAFMPGIFSGISNAAYHADKSTYSSSLVKQTDVPALAKYSIDHPSDYKDCFRIGSAIHSYILEPGVFAQEFLTGIDCARRSKADKDEWAQWFCANAADGDHIVSHKAAEWNGLFEKQSGKSMIKPEEIREIQLMAESVKSNATAIKLLESGTAEQSLYWLDDETGLQLRARPDYLSTVCTDLKSCQSARPGSVAREIHARGYGISQAMYQEGLFIATGTHHPFAFLFIEKTAPYLCAVYQLNEESAAYCAGEYRRLLLKLADCLDKNEWPGIEDNLDLALPAYAFT